VGGPASGGTDNPIAGRVKVSPPRFARRGQGRPFPQKNIRGAFFFCTAFFEASSRILRDEE